MRLYMIGDIELAAALVAAGIVLSSGILGIALVIAARIVRAK
jgi:hypothetical protein